MNLLLPLLLSQLIGHPHIGLSHGNMLIQGQYQGQGAYYDGGLTVAGAGVVVGGPLVVDGGPVYVQGNEVIDGGLKVRAVITGSALQVTGGVTAQSFQGTGGALPFVSFQGTGQSPQYVWTPNANPGSPTVIEMEFDPYLGAGAIATISTLGVFWSDGGGDFDMGGHLQSHTAVLPTLKNGTGSIGLADAGKGTYIAGNDVAGVVCISFDGGGIATGGAVYGSVTEIMDVVFALPFPDGGLSAICQYDPNYTCNGGASTSNACGSMNLSCGLPTLGGATANNGFGMYLGTEPGQAVVGLAWDGGAANCPVSYHVIGWSG